MAETVTMPKLGFDMAEGTLVRWVIQEGEPVGKGAILAEIETDKATVEVESTYEGIVARHLVKAGDIVPVNTPIAIVAAVGEKIEIPADAALPSSPAKVDASEKKADLVAPPAQVIDDEQEEGRLPGGVKASPLARRIARGANVDLKGLQGSGPKGRIIKRDIESFLAAGKVSPGATEAKATPIPLQPVSAPVTAPITSFTSMSVAPADQVIPLNRLRSAIGRRMVDAKQQVPHFYVTHEYDMAAVMDLRKQLNAMLPDDGKLSVNDFVVKAVGLALRQFPNLNASLRGDQIVRHGQVNVGVAVAVEGGLLTVVCRDTDRKPVRHIGMELREMVGRAREGKVKPDDIEGSTFSISNLGMFDVEHFIAIINPPEAAILAVGSVREVPVVKNGAVVPGMSMKATISVDHRVSDGAEAAKFLQALAIYFAEPLRLML